MNLDLLLENLTNPALLYFILGILAVYLKSDLEIPQNSSNVSAKLSPVLLILLLFLEEWQVTLFLWP